MGGVGQSSTATLAFSVWACLDGNVYRCRVHGDFRGADRILGRDVLNKIGRIVSWRKWGSGCEPLIAPDFKTGKSIYA